MRALRAFWRDLRNRFPLFGPAIRRAGHRAPAHFRRHETRLHSRQSGARRCGDRQHEDPRRGHLALCPLGAAARPQGHRGGAARPRRIHREIFRDRARFACARLCRRDVRLARPGRCPTTRSPTGKRATCAISPNTSSTSKRSWSRWCCPIARRRSTRSAIPWAAPSASGPATTAAAGSTAWC